MSTSGLSDGMSNTDERLLSEKYFQPWNTESEKNEN